MDHTFRFFDLVPRNTCIFHYRVDFYDFQGIPALEKDFMPDRNCRNPFHTKSFSESLIINPSRFEKKNLVILALMDLFLIKSLFCITAQGRLKKEKIIVGQAVEHL